MNKELMNEKAIDNPFNIIEAVIPTCQTILKISISEMID
jgi:hypothetical protein